MRRYVARIAYECEYEAEDAQDALEKLAKFKAVKKISKTPVTSYAGCIAEIIPEETA
jgi:uncharacterized protein YjbK